MRGLIWALLFVVPAAGQRLATGAQEGLPAPPFRGSAVNGGSVTLEQLVEPNGALVAFCDPRSRDGQRLLIFLDQSQPRLAEMQVGSAVWVLNYAARNSVKQLADDNTLTVPVIWDQNQETAEEYGVEAGAAAFVISPELSIHRRYDASEQMPDIGPLALGGLRDMLEALAEARADQPAEPTEPTATVTDRQATERIRAGWRLIQQGFSGTALEDARKLLAERGAGDFRAALWLAYCFEADRQYPAAAVQYRRVLRLRPGYAFALEAIARIDPTGRWQTEADLAPPEPEPAEPPPA